MQKYFVAVIFFKSCFNNALKQKFCSLKEAEQVEKNLKYLGIYHIWAYITQLGCTQVIQVSDLDLAPLLVNEVASCLELLV